MVTAQKKDDPCLHFLKKVRFEGGEKETDLWVHALFEITPVFLSFPFFSFNFLSYLFSFLSRSVSSFHSENVLCFFFSLPKIYSVFRSPLQGTARAFL